MNNFTIYCTPDQTRRAYKLGAPILTIENIFARQIIEYKQREEVLEFLSKENETICDERIVINPTAEQMCGWLRSKDINAHVGTDAYVCDSWSSFIQEALVADGDKKESWWLEAESYEIFNTYEEAMMHAIDAALSKLEEYEHSTDTADGGSQS